MTVQRSTEGTIELRGDCSLEDAEKFLAYIVADPHCKVDWSECSSAHTAIIQILLVAKPILRGPPGSNLLQKYVEPLVAL